MGGVIHAFECLAHGQFEQRVKAGTIPKCPKGCGKRMVKLVFVKAPGFMSARTKTATRLVKEMAEMQGLADLDTSPSRPGGSVMDRIRKRYGSHLLPEQMPIVGDVKKHLPAMTHKANELVGENIRAFTAKDGRPEHGSHPGHEYDPSQWKKDEKTGRVVHTNIPHTEYRPRASVERVKEKP